MADNKDKKVLNAPSKGNIPALRFPEFTEEWTAETIDELFELRNGYTPSKNNLDFWNNGTIPWFRMEDIRLNGGVLKDAIQHITPEAVKGSGLFEPYSIILATTATIGEHAMLIADSLANQRFTNFKIRKSLTYKYNPYYLYYYFFKIDKWCLKNTNAGGLLSVDIPSLKRQKLYSPSVEEQNKIAKLLRLIDDRISIQSRIIEDRISIQSRIIEDLKKLKSAIYQKIFGDLVAPTLKLVQLAEIAKGQQVNCTDLLEYGDYYVMNGGITPSGWLNRYNTEANTISISEGGNSCGYVQYNTSPYWSGGHCYSLRILHPQETLDLYLYHFLKWQENNIMALRIGSGLPNIQKKDLLRFPVILPTITQQNKIVSILSAIEEKVSCEISITKYFIKQKEYLLRQLFI